MKACDFRRTWAFTLNWGLLGFFFFLIIYLLMAAPDLGCCAGLSLSWQSGATLPCGV